MGLLPVNGFFTVLALSVSGARTIFSKSWCRLDWAGLSTGLHCPASTSQEQCPLELVLCKRGSRCESRQWL